jgi:hypothetical protein
VESYATVRLAMLLTRSGRGQAATASDGPRWTLALASQASYLAQRRPLLHLQDQSRRLRRTNGESPVTRLPQASRVIRVRSRSDDSRATNYQRQTPPVYAAADAACLVASARGTRPRPELLQVPGTSKFSVSRAGDGT